MPSSVNDSSCQEVDENWGGSKEHWEEAAAEGVTLACNIASEESSYWDIWYHFKSSTAGKCALGGSVALLVRKV